MKDFIDFVNVFQGSGEITPDNKNGLPATWFFIKAQCGNTYPHACLPFSKISCGTYSGAYPTGYGNHKPNYFGKPQKYSKKYEIRGFSHMHHSGTGAIGFYYNYALVSPFIKDLNNIKNNYTLTEEKAYPGYTSANMSGFVKCEATVSKNVAHHRYTFFENGGKIAVDFSNNGIDGKDGRHYSEHSEMKLCSDSLACASVVMEGVTLYMAAKCITPKEVNAILFENCKYVNEQSKSLNKSENNFGAVFDISNNSCAELLISISPKNMEKAISDVENYNSTFDDTAKKAKKLWNDALGKIEIDACDDVCDDVKEIFYSNLYHSLVKPSDFSGESFIFDDPTGEKDFVADFSTMWDIYKTQLPLVFALYPQMGRKIVNSLIETGETLGIIPNTIGLTNSLSVERSQARALPQHILITAYYYGIRPKDEKRLLSVMKKDLENGEYDDYINTGYCEKYTHILDMADGFYYTAALAKMLGEAETYEKYIKLSKHYKNAYDKNTGLLSDKSWYYEGGLWNYSFRLCHDMKGRIDICGKEKFVSLLDEFFGYGKEPVVQASDPNDTKYCEDRISLHRFEGYNNEPDMETPYSYAFAGRHDRLCEVVRAGTKHMFTKGRGGIPGNNDSG